MTNVQASLGIAQLERLEGFIAHKKELYDRYVAALAANTDHLKLDDALRAVLDLTADEVEALQALLETQSQRGTLAYGLHASDRALMTCFIRSSSQHLHFVDGGDGGLSQAARRLKRSAGEAGGAAD